MVQFLNVRDLAWTLTTLLEIVLLVYLLRRRLYASHPAFFIYVLATILQSIAVALLYRYLGSQSLTSWNIAWAGQAVVICARWFAVTEIARKALAEYTGIWGMASRMLFLLGFGVLVYSVASSDKRWTLAVLNADRSVELCIASFIVCMFLFVRYYRLPMSNLERLLAIGFCLYSCSYVINDSIYERWRSSLGGLWNYLDSLTFLASLLLWIGATRGAAEAQTSTVQASLSPEQYGELSRRLNSRLHMLNSRLNHLLRYEDPRS